MKKEMIAPCGMNCELCIAYLAQKNDINKQGFHRTYCPGCRPRGQHCLHMANKCEKVGNGLVEFCYECVDFPCTRLISLDKRYRTKYHMSMIENLRYIQRHGLQGFLQKEDVKWSCPECKENICCHNGLCINCNLELLKNNKKYCWDDCVK